MKRKQQTLQKQEQEASNTVKQTQQIMKIVQESKKPIIDSIQQRFVQNHEMTLVYESEDLMGNWLAAQKRGEQNFITTILLDFFRLRYQSMCYQNVYIQDVKSIKQRSLVNVEDGRQNSITYQINCIVSTDIIKVEELSLLNCQVQEINQNHNGTLIVLIAKGLESSGLQVANIFISSEVENIPQTGRYDIPFQIGMNVPCLVSKVKYAVGSPNISIFASLLKPIEIDHTYVLNFDPELQHPNHNQILSEITHINSQLYQIQERLMEYSPEIITQFLQLLQVKTLGVVTSKQVNSRFKQSEQTATLYDKISNHKKNIQIVVNIKLIDYVLGVYTLGTQQIDPQISVPSWLETVHNIVNSQLRWMQFFYEFVYINDSEKAFKQLAKIMI